MLIDGGTICLDKKTTGYRDVAHIGMGQSDNTQVQTDVTIVGGTICLIGADAYIPRPIIYGWEQVGKTWQKNNTIKDGNGTPVYYTTADLTGIYEKNTLVGDADIEESSYGFKDVRTDSNGKLYMYLPASETVKASFGGVEFTGTVKADTAENVLERELTSVDYGKEVLKNNLQSAVEFAQSKDASSWTEIPVNGAASLTEILDSQSEGTKEISLYVRKKADTSGAATEIKIPARPPKPAQIQETDITKDSYSIKVIRPVGSRYEYGIAKSESGEPEWWSERTFTSPKPANTYYITLRVKATDSSFASKPADRLIGDNTGYITDRRSRWRLYPLKRREPMDRHLIRFWYGWQRDFRLLIIVDHRFLEHGSSVRIREVMSASSIYPEVKGTTAYQAEFIPD